MNLDASGRKRAERAVILEQKRRDVFLKLHELMDAPGNELFAFMSDAVREATESEYSFIGTIEENESVMAIYSWSKNTIEQCAVGDKPLRYPIQNAGLWGDCIRQRRPLIINNYAEGLPSKKGLPACHVPVRRFMAVPVFDGNTIVAVAAVANKSEDYDRSDVASVFALTGRMWEMLRRKHAEERLQKSEAMYRQLIGLAADAIFLLSPAGQVLMANNKCSQLFGYSPEELLTMNIVDTYCEEEKEAGRQRVSTVAAGASLMIERRLRKKDGSVLLVEVNADRLPDGNIQSIVRDITSRKRAEKELNQSASLLEAVFDATPIGICIMQDRHYRRVNRFWCKRFGYSEQEVLGQTTLQLYESKEEYERVGVALYKHCENQSVSAVQTRLRCKDSTIRDVLLTAARLQSADQPANFVVAIEDITERKRVADALIEREKLFRAVATALPIGLGLAANRQIRWVNDTLLAMFGRKQKEIIGRDTRILYENDHWYQLAGTRIYAQLAQTGRAEMEANCKHATGYTINVLLIVTALDKTDFSKGIVFAVKDITREKAAEKQMALALEEDIVSRNALMSSLEDNNRIRQQLADKLTEQKRTQSLLVQSAKMASIGMLAGGVAHEINNPLTGVLNNVQLIKIMAQEKGGCPVDEFKTLLDVIEESAKRCTRITGALLSFSRTSQGLLESVTINDIIEKAVILIEHELKLQNIVIRRDFDLAVPHIKGDGQLLQQVIFDLVHNAQWAIKQKHEQRGEIFIKTSFLQDDHCVEVCVQDNGIGISRENLNHMFEPFFTTKPAGEGTGLGLSIIYDIIQKHNGTIKVESESGQGACFKVTLPEVAR